MGVKSWLNVLTSEHLKNVCDDLQVNFANECLTTEDLRTRLKQYLTENPDRIQVVQGYPDNVYGDTSLFRMISPIPEMAIGPDPFASQVGTPGKIRPNPIFGETVNKNSDSISFRKPDIRVQDADPTFTYDQVLKLVQSLAVSSDVKPNYVVSFIKEAARREISFGGKPHENVGSFFRKISETNKIYKIPDSDLLSSCVGELLTDTAKLYFTAHFREFKYWEDFESRFKQVFGNPSEDYRTKQDMMQRTQIANESVDHFISTQTLMNCRLEKPFSDGELFQLLLSNLHPDYRSYIKGRSPRSVSDLEELGREMELIRLENSRYVPPPSRLIGKLEEESRSSRLSKGSQDREKDSPVYCAATSTHGTPNPAAAPKFCLKCLEIGHLAQNCRNRNRVYCYNCYKMDVLSTECDCTSRAQTAHNADRRVRFGSSPNRSPRPNSPSSANGRRSPSPRPRQEN